MFSFQTENRVTPIETRHPMELVHVHYFTIESGKSKMLIFWLSQTISLKMLSHLSLSPKQLNYYSITVGKYFMYYSFPETII